MKKFTLIEILVVVAIIGILISLLVPSLAVARDKSRTAVCKSNLKQMGSAQNYFADDNDGFIVHEYNNTWWPLVLYDGNYLSPVEKAVTCPSEPFDGNWRNVPNNRNQIIYGSAYNYSNKSKRNGAMYGGSKADGTRYKLIKINGVDLASSFFHYADSGKVDDDGKFIQWLEFKWAKDVDRGVHIRHDNKANIWFLDGHVEACAVGRLKELGHEAVTLESKSVYPL